MSVRTRFAPSPTGYLHVGGLRTALYAYLYAKQKNGSFILRIEDTDQSRKVEGAKESLIAALQWANILFDEGPGHDGPYGPYVQSERLSIYREHVDQLIEKGNAYYCFCSTERLEQLRAGGATKYDGQCRSIILSDAKRRAANGEPHVVRLRVPDGDEIRFHDEIRGNISIALNTIDDQVLLKSDGYPTYHLAVVVDDHTMKISHVIRGEEWLPSTPKHILLYRAFGWDVPVYAHLPLLLNADKSKLSKRQGDVAVEDYRAKGYLPEALVNFVAFLGWNPGDERELFSLDELIKEFSLERVGKAGAVFNIEKLNWLNQQHIKRLSGDELLNRITPLIKSKGYDRLSDDFLRAMIGLMKERVVVLNDFVDATGYFFTDPTSYDQASTIKNWKPETAGHLRLLKDRFLSVDNFDAPTVEKALRDVAEESGVGAGKLIHPLRLALSGISNGPSLFHLAEVLGKETVLRRIDNAVTRIP